MVINLVLYWARGHREPRFLATSLGDPQVAVRMHRRRLSTEQYFKDGKQRFGLKRSSVTTTDRLRRPLLGLLPACSLLVLAELRVTPSFRLRVCSPGKLGILHA